jgi:dipeptidyl aminopeptidase/acylaminoacyl peptidase
LTGFEISHSLRQRVIEMFDLKIAGKMVCLWQVLFIAMTCRSMVGAPVAQPSGALPVEAALQMKYFSQYAPISFSSDGKWLAYAARENTRNSNIDLAFEQTGIPSYGSAANIYVINRKTGETRNLTETHNNWLPTWSPDSRLLAFLSDRDGSGRARLWVWDAKTDQLHRVTERNIRSAKIAWLADSKGVVVGIAPESSAVKPGSQPSPADKPGGTSDNTPDGPGSTAKLYEANPIAEGSSDLKSAAPWNLDRYLADLVLIPVEPAGDLKILTRGGRISAFSLSPDGTQIAYSTPRRFEQPGSQQILFDLHTVSLRNGDPRTLASGIRLNLAGDDFRWSPDGLWISYVTGGMEETRSDCYAIEVSSGDRRSLTAFSSLLSPPRTSAPIWDLAGHVYFLRQGELWRATVADREARLLAVIPKAQIKQLLTSPDNVIWSAEGGASTIVLVHDPVTEHDGFYRVEFKAGSAESLAERGGCYSCVVVQSSVWVAPGGQGLAFIREDAGSPADLWISDSEMSHSRRLTTLNPQLEHRGMGQTRLVEWLGDDGQKLKGTLLLPVNYNEGKRYPLVVWVYGGASGSIHLDNFGVIGPDPFNMQLLATRGYTVLFPDAPQSLGTPMLDLAKTVLPGINEIVNLGIADPDRVGVMGQSYGGYSTLSMITQSKRFSAAIAIAGMGDLIASYGEMDAAGSAFGTSVAEHGQDLMEGSPWQFRDRYIENSPLFFLDRVSTPLLIVHGDADRFVQPFLADEVFVGLRRLGREVTYAKYHGEGHDPMFWSYANQVDLCHRVIDWFELHLKNGAGKEDKVSALDSVGGRP